MFEVEKFKIIDESFQINYSYINRDAEMNSRRRDICNVDVHRASYINHLRSKTHLANEKQNEINIPDWLFKEPIERKENYNPKPIKQIA